MVIILKLVKITDFFFFKPTFFDFLLT